MNIRKIIREENTDSEFKSITNYHNSLVDNVYEDDDFLVAAPKTHQSSCYYGSGTQWCTTTKDSRSFDEYSKLGILFYIIDKNNKSKFAIYIPYVFRERVRWGKVTDEGIDASFDSIEVYDSDDNDITGTWWSEDEPYYYKHIKDHFKKMYENRTQIGESTEDEFKWIKKVGDGYTNVDVSKDYWGGWKSLSKPFIELGLYDLNGRVLSSDYDGNIDITLNINNRLHLSIFIRTLYQEGDDSVKVYWNLHGYIPMDSSYTKVTTLSHPAALVKELPPYSGNYNDGQLRGKEVFQPVEEVIKKYLKTYL